LLLKIFTGVVITVTVIPRPLLCFGTMLEVGYTDLKKITVAICSSLMYLGDRFKVEYVACLLVCNTVEVAVYGGDDVVCIQYFLAVTGIQSTLSLAEPRQIWMKW
jgi:hypothetical protein